MIKTVCASFIGSFIGYYVFWYLKEKALDRMAAETVKRAFDKVRKDA